MSEPRRIMKGLVARNKILKGALTLVKAVGVTYGPGGRTVMLERFAGLLATKDGVTVAQEINLPDHEENMGAQIIKEACRLVNKEVGDGTTSTAILAGAILQEGHKLIVAGLHPGTMIAGIQAASVKAVQAIQGHSLPVESKEDLYRIAIISCNGDTEIAGHLAEACMAIGKDGTISIVDGVNTETVLEFKEGMEIASGVNRAFRITDVGDQEKTLEGAFIAVFAVPLMAIPDVLSLLEESTQWPNPLVIFAPRIEGGAYTTLLMNHMPGKDGVRVKELCPIPAPGMPQQKVEFLRDIAALTTATVVDPALGMDHMTWNNDWFGSARRVVIRPETCTIEAYPDHRNSIEARLAELRRDEESLSGFELDQLRERMGKLSGGIAILRVGGVTEAAMKERRARIEDALGAVRAALRGGMVPGAGSAYLLGSLALQETPVSDDTPFKAGWQVMEKALRKPTAMLIQNAGGDPGCVHRLALHIQDSPWLGYDTTTDQIRNILQDPLVADPTDVVISAIRAAVSVTSLLLTAEASITTEGPIQDGE